MHHHLEELRPLLVSGNDFYLLAAIDGSNHIQTLTTSRPTDDVIAHTIVERLLTNGDPSGLGCILWPPGPPLPGLPQCGVIVPVQGRTGRFGFLCAASDDRAPLHRPATIDLLRSISIDALAEHWRREAPPPSTLKSAEIACLQWVARGKTTGEIATILGIRERTATFHIGCAMEKLGAASRSHAVAIAVELGLASPRPFPSTE